MSFSFIPYSKFQKNQLKHQLFFKCYLIDESYSAVNRNKSDLFALQRRMSPYSQTSAILRDEFPESARLKLRLFDNVLSGRLHTLRRFLHFDFVILNKTELN